MQERYYYKETVAGNREEPATYAKLQQPHQLHRQVVPRHQIVVIDGRKTSSVGLIRINSLLAWNGMTLCGPFRKRFLTIEIGFDARVQR